jgi:hypothetical protein
MTTREFRLYPVEQHWLSFADYGAILDVVEGLQAKRVLEFGPGSSTRALIEGGANHIDACEDNDHWAEMYRVRLQAKFPEHVQLHSYLWSDPLHVPTVNARRYDLGLIDGPRETYKRQSVVAYCLERCTRVLVPLEETDDGEHLMRGFVERLAGACGRYVGYKETGPLAGSFALIGPP